jgi:AcrR family transcriptional regulator
MDVEVAGRLALEPAGSLERRIIEGARDCCSRYGWAKTTLDDIARAAGLSRATLYRAFPGGREAVKAAVNRHDTIDFFQRIEAELAGATDLTAMLVAGMTIAARRLADDAELQFSLEHEPGEVLPQFLFRGLDDIFALCHVFVAPHLQRFVDHDEAVRLSELLARLVLSHLLEPDGFVDLTDPDATERLVRTRILPGLRLRSDAPPHLAALAAATSGR